MNEFEYLSIYRMHTEFLDNNPHIRDYKKFGMKTRHIYKKVKKLVDIISFYAVSGMCFFGPRAYGPAPIVMCREIIVILKKNIKQPINQATPFLQKIEDFFIAFGCGKWRNSHVHNTKWKSLWKNSYFALSTIVNNHLRAANRWLKDHIVGLTEHTLHMDSSTKNVLASKLIEPENIPVSFTEDLMIFCTKKGLEFPQMNTSYPPGVFCIFNAIDEESTIIQGPTKVPLVKKSKVIIKVSDKEEVIRIIHTFTIKHGQTLLLPGPVYIRFIPGGIKHFQNDLHIMCTLNEIHITSGSFSLKTTYCKLQIHKMPVKLIIQNSGPIPVAINSILVITSKTAQTTVKITKTLKPKTGEKIIVKAPVTIKFWNCTCGDKECFSKHRLSAWNPSLTLNSFIETAIKGKKGTMQTGYFTKSLYYTHLAHDGLSTGRLRLAEVEYKVCSSHKCNTYYEGDYCYKCNTPFDIKSIKRETRERIILVDSEPPPYMRQIRYKCTNKTCNNLYELSLPYIKQKVLCIRCGGSLVKNVMSEIISNIVDEIERIAGNNKMHTYKNCTKPVRNNHVSYLETIQDIVDKFSRCCHCNSRIMRISDIDSAVSTIPERIKQIKNYLAMLFAYGNLCPNPECNKPFDKQCWDLFTLLVTNAINYFQCSYYSNPLPGEIGQFSLLAITRRFQRELIGHRANNQCPNNQCLQPITDQTWCPLDCKKTGNHPDKYQCLPQNPKYVWVRTYLAVNPYDE